MWYVWEFMFLYILFFIAFKYARNFAIEIIFVTSIIVVIFAYIIGMDNPWYGSTLCFSLGIYYYRFKEKILKLNIRKQAILICTFGIIMCSSVILFFIMDGTFIGNVVFRNIASISFCSIILFLLGNVKCNNPVTNWLSVISYEIYLIHPVIIRIVTEWKISSAYIFSGIVIILTISISYFMHLIFEKINRVLL